MSLKTKPIIVGDNGVTVYFDRDMNGDYVTILDGIVTLRNKDKVLSFYSETQNNGFNVHTTKSAYDNMFEAINSKKAGYRNGFDNDVNATFLYGAINYILGNRCNDDKKPYCYLSTVDYNITSDISELITNLYVETNLINIDLDNYLSLAIFKSAEYLGFATQYSSTALREYLIHEINVFLKIEKEKLLEVLDSQGDVKILTDAELGVELLNGRNIEISVDTLPSNGKPVYVAQLFSTEEEFDSDKYDVIETLNTNRLNKDDLLDIIIKLFVVSVTTP